MTFEEAVVWLWNVGMVVGILMSAYNVTDVAADFRYVRHHMTDALYREQTMTHFMIQALIALKFVIYLIAGLLALVNERGVHLPLPVPVGGIITLLLFIGGMLLVVISVLTNRWRHHLLDALHFRQSVKLAEEQNQ